MRYTVNPRVKLPELLSAMQSCPQGDNAQDAFLEKVTPLFPGTDILTFNYGRSALQHLFRQLGLKGRKVAFPAYSCRSFGALCLAEGIEPVFVDADPRTFNISPDQLERALTKDVEAVVAIHTFGNPCDMDRLLELRDEHGFILVEDCAHALGARYNGRPVGTFGDFSLFSMYKTLPNTSGAFLVVNNPDIAVEPPAMPSGMGVMEWALLLNLLDVSESLTAKRIKRSAVRFMHRYGTQGALLDERLVEVTACSAHPLALFTHYLDRALEEVDRREAVGRLFLKRLKDIRGITPQRVHDGMSWMNVPVLIEDASIRYRIVDAMMHKGIVCDHIWHDPVIAEPGVQEAFGILPNDFPTAASIAESIVNLPISGAYSLTDIDYILSTLKTILAQRRGA
ncbi:MAG: DegT/DnrJ/EryC1/StrS family aminotransferase [Candidatus Undinarchaeales archaeon]|nr:DegT/DnrJ/EryC1/StrS family aminotransferase [Candidatus Undinarchaeales archaeon]